MTVHALYAQVIFREEENPFIKRKAESGLYIPEGMSFTNETGDMEKMDKIIGFGVVEQAGEDCKYVKKGDGIFYDRRSVRAVPCGEVLWNMPEVGMVGYIKADELNLDALKVESAEFEKEITARARERAAQEKEASQSASAKEKVTSIVTEKDIAERLAAAAQQGKLKA